MIFIALDDLTVFKNLVFKEITSLRLKLEKCQRIGSKNGILIQNWKKHEEKLISIEKRITNQSNVEELDLFQDGIQSLLKPIKFQKEIEEFSDVNLKNLNQRIDRLGTIYNIRLSQVSQYGQRQSDSNTTAASKYI